MQAGQPGSTLASEGWGHKVDREDKQDWADKADREVWQARGAGPNAKRQAIAYRQRMNAFSSSAPTGCASQRTLPQEHPRQVKHPAIVSSRFVTEMARS